MEAGFVCKKIYSCLSFVHFWRFWYVGFTQSQDYEIDALNAIIREAMIAHKILRYQRVKLNLSQATCRRFIKIRCHDQFPARTVS